jgi:hypothetical protein
MRLAAVMPRMGSIRGLFGPLEDCQLCVTTMDYDPVRRIIALFAANFTLINCSYHRLAPKPIRISDP